MTGSIYAVPHFFSLVVFFIFFDCIFATSLGGKPTISPLHYDDYENFLCQISGEKEVSSERKKFMVICGNLRILSKPSLFLPAGHSLPAVGFEVSVLHGTREGLTGIHLSGSIHSQLQQRAAARYGDLWLQRARGRTGPAQTPTVQQSISSERDTARRTVRVSSSLLAPRGTIYPPAQGI